MDDKKDKYSLKDFPEVTRFEIIDDKGRAYVNYSLEGSTISLQDQGRTLKVFINGDFNELFARASTLVSGIDVNLDEPLPDEEV